MSKLKFGAFLAGALITINSFAFAQDEAGESAANTSSNENVKMQVVATKTAKSIDSTSANVTVISSEDIETRTGQSLINVLRDFGVVIQEGLSYAGTPNANSSISIRGNDGGDVAIIVDGQKILVSSGSVVVLQNIPLSNIEKIEILEGPSSFLYGSDAGGVISITTKNGKGMKEGLSVNFGASYGNNFGDFKSHITKEYLNIGYGFANGSSITLGGTFEYANPFVSDYTPELVGWTDMYDPSTYLYANTPNEKYDYMNFGVNLGGFIKIADNQDLSITALYAQKDMPAFFEDLTGSVYTKTAVLGLAYNWYALDNLDIKISTGFSLEQMASEVPSYDYVMTNTGIQSDTEIFAAYYANDILTLKGGYALEVRHNIFNDVKGLTDTKYENSHTSIGNALFAGVDIDIDTDIGFDIDLTVGARYEFTTQSSEDLDIDPTEAFSPELGIVIKPIVDWFAIKANVGRSFKNPEFTQAFAFPEITPTYTGNYRLTNPELEPETAWTYSGTLEFYPIKNAWTISATVFRTDAENLIEITEAPYEGKSLFEFVNVGTVLIYGYDIGTSFSKEFGSAGVFGAGFNFEQLWAYDTTEKVTFTDGSEDYARLDRPEYTISGNISWQKPEWGTLVRLSGIYYADGYNYDYMQQMMGIYDEARPTSGYSTLDLRIAQDLHALIEKCPETTVWFEVKNLLNHRVDIVEQNQITGEYYQDGDDDNEGINFMVGFDMKF